MENLTVNVTQFPSDENSQIHSPKMQRTVTLRSQPLRSRRSLVLATLIDNQRKHGHSGDYHQYDLHDNNGLCHRRPINNLLP